MTKSNSPYRAKGLSEPQHTSLAHAVRWIASGEPFLGFDDQEATGDSPEVEHADFLLARHQLLLALRHQTIKARATLSVRHNSILGRDPDPNRRGSARWSEFLKTTDGTTGCLNVEGYRSSEPVVIPGLLWEDRLTEWKKGMLSCWVGDHQVWLHPIEIPTAELLDAFSISADQPLTATSALNRPLHAKEKESLLRLVIGMAVEQYGYDPRAKRSDAVKNIGTDLDNLGISLDADTIRKYLRAGHDLLPRGALGDPED